MSNSKLVNYTKISPNKNSPRNNTIKKITIHHMAGNCTIEACGAIFANPNRKASSNYGIGTDGRVGMYVEEKDRSWCSSSGSNDHQAITIEVANDGGAPQWHVSDKALAKCIELCVDICKRNGIKKLNYTGDINGNLTLHKWFAATACPGPYLESKMPYIASEVNKRLTATTETPSKPSNPTAAYNKGDAVKLSKCPLYASATATKVSSYKTGTFYIYDGQKVNGRYRITTSKSRCGKKPVGLNVTGWVKL